MSSEFPSQADWTATVELAVASEIVRRRRWLRAYLTLLLVMLLATLALVGLQRRDTSGRLAAIDRQLPPLAAAADRLHRQDVDLAVHQVDLGRRLARLETEVQSLDLEIRARTALPPALLVLPAQQARQGRQLSAVEGRVTAVERAGHRSDTAAAADRTRVERRLAQLDSAVAALSTPAPAPPPVQAPVQPALQAAAPPVAPSALPQRLDRLEQRLDRLERTAVRSGAADLP